MTVKGNQTSKIDPVEERRRRGGGRRLGLHLSTQHPGKPTAEQQPAGGGEGRKRRGRKREEKEKTAGRGAEWKDRRKRRRQEEDQKAGRGGEGKERTEQEDRLGPHEFLFHYFTTEFSMLWISMFQFCVSGSYFIIPDTECSWQVLLTWIWSSQTWDL